MSQKQVKSLSYYLIYISNFLISSNILRANIFRLKILDAFTQFSEILLYNDLEGQVTVEIDDLVKFSKKHKIKIASIEDIIAHRLKNEKLVYKSFSKNISLKVIPKLQLSVYKNKLNQYESFVLTKGKFSANKPIPVRVISKKISKAYLLKNIEIQKNLKLLSKYKNFVLVIINGEMNKEKNDTNITLRYYGIGAQIIKDLKVKNMILLSRTRKKIIGLEGFGLKIRKQLIIK